MKSIINKSGREENRLRKAILGSVWYFISSLVPALGTFLIFSLASRQITPHDLGMVTLALTISITLTGLCAIGFGDALIQYQKLKEEHLNTVFCLLFFTSTLLYFISVVVVYLLDISTFDSFFKTIYPIIGLKIIFDSCAILPLSILTKHMNFKMIGIRTIYCAIGSICVSLPILYFGGGAWAMVVSQLLSSLISFFILWFSSRVKPRVKFDKYAYADLRSFGFTTTLSRLVTSVSVDNILIGFLGNATTLGIYSFSRRIFSIVSDVLSGALSNVSYPLYSSMQEKLDELKVVYMKTTFLSATIGIPSFLGLILLSPYLIPLIFGEHWVVAVVTVQYCCSIGFISCIGSLQLSLMKGLGQTSWILKYQLFQQLTTAAVAIIFAKSGAESVTMAIAIKTYLIWPYAVFHVSNTLNLNPFRYLFSFVKPIVSAIAMFVFFEILSRFFTPTDHEAVFIITQIVMCAIVYIIAMLLISRKELVELKVLLKK
ncbi:TPA: oligosaccharide flippase family protein [Klebsiella quasipneumoniae subsp. similipneumoniae]|nr:oligosaccharide flippase family protein [Klebsiella quasipneumoniae subsp. similipneumoniae]